MVIVVYIIEALVIAAAIYFIVVLGLRLFRKGDGRRLPIKWLPLILIVVVVFRIVWAFTFYGNRGGGSYIRIPLEKPYHIIYDYDLTYYVISDKEADFYSEPLLEIGSFNVENDLVYGELMKRDTAYFIFDLHQGKKRFFMDEGEYLIGAKELNISRPLNLLTAKEYYDKYWFWYLGR
jgi:hypothetical protein